MDGNNMEPRDRVHKIIFRLHELLRGTDGEPSAYDGG